MNDTLLGQLNLAYFKALIMKIRSGKIYKRLVKNYLNISIGKLLLVM